MSEPTTTTAASAMKLSEAIRAGAALRPQATRAYFCDGATCALGAAYEAVMGAPPEYPVDAEGDIILERLRLFFPRIGAPVSFPGGAYLPLNLYIAELNDQELWTREQIADWLEGQGF